MDGGFTLLYRIALLSLPAPTFKLILDSIVWGFKHTMRDIADTGLLICIDLLGNVAKLDGGVSGAFYQNYYLTLFQDVFYVLTDREHKSGNHGDGALIRC